VQVTRKSNVEVDFAKGGKVASTCRNRNDDVVIYIRPAEQLPGSGRPSVCLLPIENAVIDPFRVALAPKR